MGLQTCSALPRVCEAAGFEPVSGGGSRAPQSDGELAVLIRIQPFFLNNAPWIVSSLSLISEFWKT